MKHFLDGTLNNLDYTLPNCNSAYLPSKQSDDLIIPLMPKHFLLESFSILFQRPLSSANIRHPQTDFV